MITRYKTKAAKRKVRIRAKIKSISSRPRLSIHRTNKVTYAQIIDDKLGVTLASANSSKIKTTKKLTKVELAKLVGQEIAKAAKLKKVTTVVFDRGQYKYHGRVKALAESAREAGLKF